MSKFLILYHLESPNLEIDDKGLKVRPVYKQCIVIIREIPKDTSIEVIKVC